MSNDNSSAQNGGCANSLAMPIIFAVIGYFVYAHSTPAALGIFLYALGMGVVAWFGVIPIVGVGIYVWLGNVLGTYILGATGIVAGTLTAFIFWWYFAAALILGIVVIVIALDN